MCLLGPVKQQAEQRAPGGLEPRDGTVWLGRRNGLLLC